jgi:hypothetical protein
MSMSKLRLRIAKAARELYAGQITFDQLLELAPEQDKDELIDELVDLIEHEPQRGGFLGVKEKEHDAYIKQIFEVIERLERHPT